MNLLVSIRAAAPVEKTYSPAFARAGFLVAVVGAAATGFWASGGATNASVAAAGDELTHLLRAMAALKALMAAAIVGAFLWRLAVPIGIVRYLAGVVSCGAMASGTAMIWAMAHVGSGALFLHAGLLASIALLWFDPAVAARLSALVAKRRRAR